MGQPGSLVPLTSKGVEKVHSKTNNRLCNQILRALHHYDSFHLTVAIKRTQKLFDKTI